MVMFTKFEMHEVYQMLQNVIATHSLFITTD